MTAHWGIPDPAAATGTDNEREQAFIAAFNRMKTRVALFTALQISTLAIAGLGPKLNEIGQKAGDDARF